MAYLKEEWWHTDAAGRRIGWMWPEDFSAMLSGVYGDRKWIANFSGMTGIARATVDRWRLGRLPIPKHIAQLVLLLAEKDSRGEIMMDIDAPWLPVGEGANFYRGI